MCNAGRITKEGFVKLLEGNVGIITLKFPRIRKHAVGEPQRKSEEVLA